MMRCSSKNASCAISKATPCFSSLRRLLASSHSKLGSAATIWVFYHNFVWLLGVNSVVILGQRRQRHGGDACLLQRSRFFEARLAIDAPRLRLPVMHLAGLLGEGRADMLGIGLKMGAEILEEGIGLLAPDRLKRFGRFGRPSPHGRGHGRLLHLGAAATGTEHGAGGGPLVVGVARCRTR